MKNKKILTEYFIIDPSRGAIAALSGLSKPGYRLFKIDRKFDKCKVTFLKIK